MRHTTPALLVIATLFLAVVPVSYSAPAPTVSISPQDSTGRPGDSFMVNVDVSEVTDLTSYDITVRYQSEVLTATGVTLQQVNGFEFNVISMLMDDGTGTVRVIAGLGGDSVTVPGSATLFTISYTVDDWGRTPLDIATAKLGIVQDGFPTVVEPAVRDGNFETPPLIVDLDIKPGSDENPINVKEQGEIAVAILTNPSFDASSVDIGTIMFGRTGTEAAPVGYPPGGTLEDVDGDGDLDHVFHFRVQDTGIMAGDTEAKITGITLLGTPFEGTDNIRAFLPGDVDMDLDVDIIDASLLAYAFDSRPNDPLWNKYADFNENNVIDIVDASILAFYFGTNA